MLLLPHREIANEPATAVAFYDKFPVYEGHALIIPKRHTANYFDLTVHQRRAMSLFINRCKGIIQNKFNEDSK